jgi:hypothetical protein
MAETPILTTTVDPTTATAASRASPPTERPDICNRAKETLSMSTIASIQDRRARVRTAVRLLGALVLLFVGADHYYEYSADQYSVLPTIGTLFLLNFISATAIGLLLLAPIERLLRRFGRAVLLVATVTGAFIAATSLVALLVSEQTKLFGFMESNYRPAIIVAIATEAAAAVLLVSLLVLTLRGGRADARRKIAGASRPRASTVTDVRATSLAAVVALQRHGRSVNRRRQPGLSARNGRATAQVKSQPRHDRDST